MTFKRSILIATIFYLHIARGDDLEYVKKWRNAIAFWTDAMCSVQRTKTINFYGIFANGASPLFQFLDSLSHGVSGECKVVITLNTCTRTDFPDTEVSAKTTCGERWPVSSSYHRFSVINSRSVEPSVARKPRSLGKDEEEEEEEFVGLWEINVIVVNDASPFRDVLDDGASDRWNAKRHFIVLLVWNESAVEPHRLNSTIAAILEAFWTERKIQSVILSAPFFDGMENTLYTYNPFVKVGEKEWGQVEEISVGSKREVLHILATLTCRRTRNLNGYPVYVGLFEQVHTILKMRKGVPAGSIYEYSAGYNGSDGTALGTIAKHMNFKVHPVEPTDGIRFGYQHPNKTYLGTLGDVVYGRANASFVSFFVKRYGDDMNGVEFTSHVEFDRVCVVVPKAHKIPKWLRIYYIFQPSVWAFATVSQITICLTWYFIQISQPRRSGKVDFWMTTYKTVLINTGCPQKLPKSNSERILFASVFFASLTMAGIICGILYKSFSQDLYYKDIDELEELDASGLSIAYSTFDLDDLFGVREDPALPDYMKRLTKKIVHGHNSLYYASLYRNVSGLMRERHYDLVREEYVAADGSHLLHLVKECPGTFYLAYLLPKNSVFHESINILIDRLNQAGLLTLWHKRNLVDLVYQKKLDKKIVMHQHIKGYVPFKLSDLQMSLYTLWVGLSIATISFFYEKAWLKKGVEKLSEKWRSYVHHCTYGDKIAQRL